MNPKLERFVWAFVVASMALALHGEKSFLFSCIEAASIALALFNLTNIKEKQ